MVRLLRLAILGAIVLTTTVLMALPRAGSPQGTTTAPAAPDPAGEPAPPVVTEPVVPGARPWDPAPEGPPAAASPRTHVVASGETLGKIARRYYGDEKEWRRIAEANPAVKPQAIRPGDVLVLPPRGPARGR
ncbi:MAG: LysM peptidoglycan-binding domain-containing protein [Planctomycetales bacterium]|nr:LysM peptidoglycan-binding domain-containing protein [Planctomycetales bacterium]